MVALEERGRKARRFRAAIALAGTTIEGWAKEQGVTYRHLQFVLTGERESVKLEAAIDEFIAAHMPAEATA